jgi:glycine/D-amino acid oxidase-like deaminating enzyme
MATRYGRSPWVDLYPKSRIPSYPRHREPVDVEVAIIGGGLTGCTVAYAFAAAGIKVALFEADRLGRGASGSASGWIADDPGTSFADAAKAIGLRAARHAWQSWRRAALDFTALLRRLDVKCHLEACPALRIAVTPEDAARLKKEQKARKDAGLEAPMINGRAVADEAALTASAALRTRESAVIDPYRATLGIAAAAADRGALIFEKSPVTRITFTRKTADVFVNAHPLRVKRVIVATGVPTPLFKPLARHFWFHTLYLVLTDPIPGRVRSGLGKRTAVVRDSSVPPHVLRWVEDERLLVSGADGDALPARVLDKVVVQRTGQLMYELSTMYPDVSGVMPAYGWSAPYVRTADGLPFIGPHRNYPHHLFAWSDASHSVTGAYLASRMLLRHHLSESDSADEAFGFR